MRTATVTERSSGRCSESDGANWSSISTISNSPGGKTRRNADAKFTRNRVRSLVLPLLEREFNPAVVENFAELAEIARDEEDYWENEISGWLGTVVQWSEPEWIARAAWFRRCRSRWCRIGQPPT